MVRGLNSALSQAIVHDIARATKAVGTSLRRLSSGKRIMNAFDGTGAEISMISKLDSQSRGIHQAALNINTAQGFVNVADGALNQMLTIAYNLRELAEKANDSSLTSDERDSIEEEADGLVEDLTNIANNTYFRNAGGSTFYLLDNSFGSMQLQAGPNQGNSFSFSIGDARTSTLGKLAIYSGSQGSISSAIVGNVTFNGVTIDSSVSDGVSTVNSSSSSLAIVTAINSSSGSSGVYAESLGTIRTLATDFAGAASFNGVFSTNEFVLNGVSIQGTYSTATLLTSAINASTSSTGVVASLNGTDITLTAADGRNIALTIASANVNNGWDVFNVSSNFGVLSTWSSLSANGTTSSFGGAIRIWSSEAITIAGTSPSAALGISSGTKNLVSGSDVASIDLSSTTGAAQAAKILDATIAQISTLRAEVGAVHSRLDSTASYLLDSQQAVDTAKSSIEDVDFVLETANLVMAQLLQDAGIASLTQANLSQQRVLSLLQDL